MKNKKNIFLFTITLLVILMVCYFVFSFYKTSEKNLENETASLTINSMDLVNSYRINEEKSDRLYTGKIIEVTGFVKEITFLNNRNTILLNSNSETFGLICDINPNQKNKIEQLKEHQKIKVKGICKGFLKDVILLNCSLDLIPNE
ncbi:MAG: OB-fold putative lipoprotein [Polaribacter sp.]|nr:OB-fold putative lipoprotein [Polaribacter sp.]